MNMMLGHGAGCEMALQKRGNKALKPPRNEELYICLFKHSALPDCRVTLASGSLHTSEGRQRKW